MKKISVNQLTTMGWSFDEDVVFYRSRGIKRIGVALAKIHDFGVEKSRELLTDAGMTASSLGTLTFTNELSGLSLDEQVCQAHRAMELAAYLGADNLVLHTGGQAGHLRKNRFCVVKKVIDKLLPIAEEYAIVLAMEPLGINETSPRFHSHSLQDCVELIDLYRTSHLKLVLDLFQVGNDFSILNRAWISSSVSLIQVSDFVEERNRRLRAPIGTGNLNFPGFCDLLEQASYTGVFEFELYGELFDLISYQQTISSVADNLAVTPVSSMAEYESIRA